MSLQPLVIIGCGGFGRETCSIVDAINADSPRYELLGFLDDSPSDLNLTSVSRIDMPVLGGLKWLESHTQVQAIIAIGAPSTRRALDQRWPHQTWATLVHPESTIGLDVTLAPGTVIAPGARISTAVHVGRHAHLDQNATVGHDCILGDYVRLNPQACVSGSVSLGNAVTIGANATVLQGLAVGDGATVGAGAVVVRSVSADQIVKGVPAR